MKRYLTIFATDTILNTLPYHFAYHVSWKIAQIGRFPRVRCISHIRIMCMYTSCIEDLLYPYRLGTKARD